MSGKVQGLPWDIIWENSSLASEGRSYWTGVEERVFWGPGHHGNTVGHTQVSTLFHRYFTYPLIPGRREDLLPEIRHCMFTHTLAALLESFLSLRSHLLSSLPRLNGPIQEKHPQTAMTSPLTTTLLQKPHSQAPVYHPHPSLFWMHSIRHLIMSCLVQFWNVSCVLMLIFQQDYKLLEGKDNALFCFCIASKTYYNANFSELKSFKRL